MYVPTHAGVVCAGVCDVQCSNSNCCGLASAEGNDAPDGVVRRDANRHAITRNDFDSKAAHSAAELREYFVAGIALHAVKSAAVHGDHGALHVDEIVLAQIAKVPFLLVIVSQTGPDRSIWRFGDRVIDRQIAKSPGEPIYRHRPSTKYQPRRSRSQCEGDHRARLRGGRT